jgi:CheY-like chemotaxis protein
MTPHCREKLILLLEDNAHDVEHARHLLRSIAPLVAVSGRRDYEVALKRANFDLIIVDFDISGFSGFDAIAFAKVHAPGIPVILLTGSISDDQAARALHNGACDYFLKDRPARMQSAVKKLLGVA